MVLSRCSCSGVRRARSRSAPREVLGHLEPEYSAGRPDTWHVTRGHVAGGTRHAASRGRRHVAGGTRPEAGGTNPVAGGAHAANGTRYMADGRRQRAAGYHSGVGDSPTVWWCALGTWLAAMAVPGAWCVCRKAATATAAAWNALSGAAAGSGRRAAGPIASCLSPNHLL